MSELDIQPSILMSNAFRMVSMSERLFSVELTFVLFFWLRNRPWVRPIYDGIVDPAMPV